MLSEIPGPSVLRMLVPLWGSTWQNNSEVLDYRLRLDGISGILLILISFLTYYEYLMGWGKPAQYVTGAASISLLCECYVYIMGPHFVWNLWYFMVPYISSGCDLPEWDIGRSMDSMPQSQFNWGPGCLWSSRILFFIFSGWRACLHPLIRVHVTRRYVFGVHLVCGGICMSRPRGRSVMLSEIPGPSVLRMQCPYGAPLGKTNQWSQITACGLMGSLVSSSSLYPSLPIVSIWWTEGSQHNTWQVQLPSSWMWVLCIYHESTLCLDIMVFHGTIYQ